MIISCMMVVIESLGNYAILAKVSQEKSPPLSSLNRAIMGEGIGACLAGLMGVGTGVTTYSENIAAVAITRVASRFTMQIASLILIFIGIFTKLGAVFATIPEAMIGGVLSMGLCMLTGIGIALIQSVDLKLSRNVTILGIATIMGMIVPDYFAENPIDVGNPEISQTLNILFNIRQFTGGIVACVLDNFVGGATRAQRGFTDNDELLHSHDNDSDTLEQDGYSFPKPVNKVLKKLPILSKLPFMPSLKRLS
uniref:Uncharacterized protein n=1 Tax=Acrobeloides nanus TaxID=290746 RepID=A0A914CWP9_9BILA